MVITKHILNNVIIIYATFYIAFCMFLSFLNIEIKTIFNNKITALATKTTLFLNILLTIFTCLNIPHVKEIHIYILLFISMALILYLFVCFLFEQAKRKQ